VGIPGVPGGVHLWVEGGKQDMVVDKGEEYNKGVLHIRHILRCSIHRWLLEVWVVVCSGTNQSIRNMRHPRFVLAEWHGSQGVR
jgi:hypothetical protein